MTKEDLTLGLTSVLRHVMTVGAGVLAAHGLAGGDQLITLGGGIAVFIATLGWSLVEKSKLLSALCQNLPVSELEALAANLMKFRAQGANPLLITNIAQTTMAIAQQELLAAHPELAPPPTTVAPSSSTAAVPASAPVSSPVDGSQAQEPFSGVTP